MPTLKILSGKHAGQTLSFDRAVVVGRGSMADLVVDEATVSRRHALFNYANGECLLSDLQTGNGTFVNGHRIDRPTLLKDGDALRLGRVEVSYAAEAEASARPSAPAPLVEEQEAGPPSIMLRLDADPRHGLAAGGSAQRLALLAELVSGLGQSFDEAALVAHVMDQLFALFPQAERGFVMLCGPDGELVPRVARRRDGSATTIAASRTLLREVTSSRQGVLSVDTSHDTRFSEAQSLVHLEIRSVVCVPLLAHSEVWGVLQLDSSSAAQPFEGADVSLALSVASQLALALANARLHAQVLEQELLHRDLDLARKIQRRFLPRRLPERPGLAVAVEYAPALAVGGDVYDFLELPDGRLGFAVGDVSGKGVSAALYAAKLSSELRYAAVGERQPSALLARVNRLLAGDNEEAMFATLVLACLDLASGELRVTSAGHLPPLVHEASGRVVSLELPIGAPLGVREDASFEERRFVLERGDVALLMTDGVTEAMNCDQQTFGDERLRQALRLAGGSPAGALTTLLSAVRGFVDGEPQSDDLTVVCFGRT